MLLPILVFFVELTLSQDDLGDIRPRFFLTNMINGASSHVKDEALNDADVEIDSNLIDKWEQTFGTDIEDPIEKETTVAEISFTTDIIVDNKCRILDDTEQNYFTVQLTEILFAETNFTDVSLSLSKTLCSNSSTILTFNVVHKTSDQNSIEKYLSLLLPEIFTCQIFNEISCFTFKLIFVLEILYRSIFQSILRQRLWSRKRKM